MSVKLDVEFKKINLNSNFTDCLAFRRDSYFCSFGNLTGFEESVVGYKARIMSRLTNENWFYIHIWASGKIIGQLEFRCFSDLPKTGYVHLIYIVPEYRGYGVATLAQQFIVNTLLKCQCKGAILSVSRTNQRAVNFYSRQQWQYLKANPKHVQTDFYQLHFLK